MYKPLSNHVLIEPDKKENVTQSGIVLPESSDKKQVTGKIVAMGPGKTNDKGDKMEMGVKVGEKVLFKEPWSNDNKIKDGDKEYFLVEEDDILAIIE